MELLAPVSMPPLARRRSALDAERAAVEKMVERDHHLAAGAARRRGSYLPPAPSSSSGADDFRLRDAKRAIQVCRLADSYYSC